MPRAVHAVGADRRHILRSTDFGPLQHFDNAAHLAAVQDGLLFHPDLLRHRHHVVIECFRPAAQLWLTVDDQVVAAATITGSGQDP